MPNDLFVGTFYRKFGIVFHCNLNLLRNIVEYRVRKTKREIQMFSFYGSLEADPVDLQLFDITITDSLYHIIYKSPSQPMQGFRLRIVALTLNHNLVLLHNCGHTRGDSLP